MYFLLPVVTFIGFSWLYFGGVLRAMSFSGRWTSHLGAPLWGLFLIPPLLISGYLMWHLHRKAVLIEVTSAVFIGLFMTLSVISVGTYADIQRRQVIAEFSPDKVFQNPFLTSLHSAPKEFQFFLHAGAMKDCRPYAFSYRTMSMYELKDSVDHNVLPSDWLRACGRGDP